MTELDQIKDTALLGWPCFYVHILFNQRDLYNSLS